MGSFPFPLDLLFLMRSCFFFSAVTLTSFTSKYCCLPQPDPQLFFMHILKALTSTYLLALNIILALMSPKYAFSLPYGLLYSSSYSNLHLAPNRTCKLNSGLSFQNYSSSFPSISNANSILPMHCPNLESPTTSFFFSYQSIIKIGFKIGLSLSDVTIVHPVKATIILSLDYSNSLTIITDYFFILDHYNRCPCFCSGSLWVYPGHCNHSVSLKILGHISLNGSPP